MCPGANELNAYPFFFWYGTGPVRDDNLSVSTLPSPIVAVDPLGQKQLHLQDLSSVK